MVDRAGGGNRGSRGPSPRGRGGRPGVRGRGPGGGAATPPRRTGGLNLRRLDGDNFELIHPKCVEELWPDYEEGLEIWKAGEPDEARDALRYALQGCGDNLWVHVALGRIALDAGKDPTLARGHFGYAFELARKAIPADFTGKLPPSRKANRPFYDAIDGLIVCHEALGDSQAAQEIRALARKLGG
ncbi:MAG: hypothetical protein JWN86_3846 [Planctomycetota bacterium]|nr:hypothetical protein [Planctomycetota bacterium]